MCVLQQPAAWGGEGGVAPVAGREACTFLPAPPSPPSRKVKGEPGYMAQPDVALTQSSPPSSLPLCRRKAGPTMVIGGRSWTRCRRPSPPLRLLSPHAGGWQT